MRVVAVLLVFAAAAAAVATAVLILRLPDPPAPDHPDFDLEVETGTFTERNAARRNDYLFAGGIVSVTLLGGALVLAIASGRGTPRRRR